MELIAHRGANTPEALAAVPPEATTVELDVHLGRRGGLEVRHAKRLLGTNRLWERWYLLPAGTEMAALGPILPLLAARPGLGVWIDCKGVSPRLVPRLAAALDGAGTGPVTMSSRSWWLLGPAARRPGTRVLRSIGNRLDLVLLRLLPSRVRLDGVVVHRRLLDADRVAWLRRRHGLVVTWSVPDVAAAAELARWGVDGLILDGPDLVRAVADLVQPTVERGQAGRDHPGGGQTGQ